MIIKAQPEDFIVEEISEKKLEEHGPYLYFWLEKKSYNTIKAVQVIADKLRLPLKRFGFAGNKDKQAVTKQLCSVQDVAWERLEKMQLRDIALTFVGYGDEPVYLGNLKGNQFHITVRDVDAAPSPLKQFVNYFGEQRFQKQNSVIGKHLVKKEFKKAVHLLQEEHNEVKEYISAHPTDFIGSLRALPRKLLQLYLHSYQSLMWNEVVKEAVSIDVTEVPLLGFGTAFENEKVKELYSDIMNKEGIGLRDFICKQIPHLSSEGSSRAVYAPAHDLAIEDLADDELNPGKKKVVLHFWLEKGCYATEFIKQIFA